MQEIIKLAKANNLIVIEDAAESHGASIKKKSWFFWKLWNI